MTDDELRDDLHTRVVALSGQGDALADAGLTADAVAAYRRALELLPAPYHRWEAATWLYTAIGDAHFLSGQFEEARQALTLVMFCPGALDNAFIRLRRGQTYFELGDLRRASDDLACAYMAGGEQIFEGEDPKYARFILPQLRASLKPGEA